MRSSLFAAATAFAFLVAGTANAATKTYNVVLNGAQETPAVTTTATGSGSLVFDDGTKMLTGTVSYDQTLTVSVAHIHQGGCGTAGPLTKTLTADNDTHSITINDVLSNAQATALVGGNLYVNLRTTAYPDGEIRGQIYASDSGDTCPAGSSSSGDAGASGTSGSSGSSGSPGSSGSSGDTSSSSSSSSGATTVRSDAGASAPPATGDGCSTTGSAPGGGLAIAVGVGLAALSRNRNRRRR